MQKERGSFDQTEKADFLWKQTKRFFNKATSVLSKILTPFAERIARSKTKSMKVMMVNLKHILKNTNTFNEKFFEIQKIVSAAHLKNAPLT